MKSWERAKHAFVLGTLFLVSSCARPQIVLHQDSSPLSELVRTYGRGFQPNGSASVRRIADNQRISINEAEDSESEYSNQIALYLVDKNYDALEQAAHDARVGKSRFKGGVWKLYMFYDGLGKPTLGDQATDEDWNSHINALRTWEAVRPDSAAPRIALAETYMNFAEKARGVGYAETVSDAGWKLYAERNELAGSALTDAAQLKEKCPYWFDAMQQLAIAQGLG
jgi:hypothetical protein